MARQLHHSERHVERGASPRVLTTQVLAALGSAKACTLLVACLLACASCAADDSVDSSVDSDEAATPSEVFDADEAAQKSGVTNVTFPARGAFYYPWFPETWTVNGAHVAYKPKLGYYDSSDDTAIDKHIDMMDYGKIDVAIASWWGKGTHHETTRIAKLLDHTKMANSPLKWAFLYEDEGFGDPSATTIASDLDYLTTTYGSSSAVARINGKPVVFVYAADDKSCEVATRWAKAKTLLTKGGWYVNLKLFKNSQTCAHQPDQWHQYGPDTPAQEHAGHSYAIAPGFWRADQSDPVLARDPVRFKKNVKDMVASNEPWQLITTFNEWGEGTATEPAAAWKSNSGYGKYLDALHTNGQ